MTDLAKMESIGVKLRRFFRDPDREMDLVTEALIREYCSIYESIYIFPAGEEIHER